MTAIPVFPIDSGVPIPEDKAVKMPLASLEVGQSILFPLNMRKNVQSQAASLSRRSGKVFTVRKQSGETARIWRKE